MLASLAGCIGVIGDGGSGQGTGGSGASSSGGASSGGDASAGGDSGTPGAVAGPCDNIASARRVWTLSRPEYDKSVAAVLGNTSNQAQTTFPPEDRANGFVDNAQSEVVTSALINTMMTAAEAIAAQSVNTELSFIQSSLGCTLASAPTTANPDACAVKYIGSRGAALFRRPLTNDEAKDMYAAYMSGYGNPFSGASATTSGVQNVIATLLQMPQFFYRTELGSPSDTTSNPVQMTQYEIASAISYLASGGPPDSTLMAAAAAGSLTTPDAIAAQYSRIQATPAGHAQLEQFVLQSLNEDQVGSMGTASGPVTPKLAGEMMTEAQDFIDEAVFNGSGTVSELLTGDYTFVNADLASFYGLPAVASSSFTKVTLSQAAGRAGLLSQGAFLITNSQPGVPLLHRGHLVREEVLCEQLPAFTSVGLPAGFTPPPFSTPPYGTTTRQALSTAIVGVCLTCHQYFMPIGFGLQNFDTYGRYQSMDNGGAVDPSGELVESTSVDPNTGQILAPTSSTQTAFKDYAGLTSTLAADPRANRCFADHVASYLSGRSAGLNECAVQTTLTPPSGSSSANIQQQFLNYVRSPNFIMRSR
jgi:hypothetical protein